jgi:hypothetical protein
LIPHNWIVPLNIVSAAAWTVATLLLYWGSLGVPWKLRSWSGQTTNEKLKERRQRIMAFVGIPCVFIGAGCQIAALFGSD